MFGASEYTKWFTPYRTKQYGRLVLVSSKHTIGTTFRIFVLPKEEQVKYNGSGNPPLNKNAVEVYGVVAGTLGYTERYDWLHHGPWKRDFLVLLAVVKHKAQFEIAKYTDLADKQREEREAKQQELLDSYV